MTEIRIGQKYKPNSKSDGDFVITGESEDKQMWNFTATWYEKSDNIKIATHSKHSSILKSDLVSFIESDKYNLIYDPIESSGAKISRLKAIED